MMCPQYSLYGEDKTALVPSTGTTNVSEPSRSGTIKTSSQGMSRASITTSSHGMSRASLKTSPSQGISRSSFKTSVTTTSGVSRVGFGEAEEGENEEGGEEEDELAKAEQDDAYWDNYRLKSSKGPSVMTREFQPTNATSTASHPTMIRLQTRMQPGTDVSVPWAPLPYDFREAQGKSSVKSVRFDRLMTRATPSIPPLKTYASRRTNDVMRGITLDVGHSHHLLCAKMKLKKGRRPSSTSVETDGNVPYPGIRVNSLECGRYRLPWEVVYDLYPASYNLGITD